MFKFVIVNTNPFYFHSLSSDTGILGE